MRTYELVLILPPEFSEEEQNKILEKIKKIVEAEKGKVLEKTSWGKKELSYPILKKTSGIYWLLTFELSPELATNLSKQLKLNEQVLRYLLVRR